MVYPLPASITLHSERSEESVGASIRWDAGRFCSGPGAGRGDPVWPPWSAAHAAVTPRAPAAYNRRDAKTPAIGGAPPMDHPTRRLNDPGPHRPDPATRRLGDPPADSDHACLRCGTPMHEVLART